jgi:hypothetical protein
VSRLHQGGFVESHAISERTRRERLALIEQSKAEFVQKKPTPEPVPAAPTNSADEKAEKAIRLVGAQIAQGDFRTAREKAKNVKTLAAESEVAARWVSENPQFFEPENPQKNLQNGIQ